MKKRILLSVVVVLLYCIPSHAAISRVQVVYHDCATTNPCSITISSTTAGSLLIVASRWDGNTGTPYTLTCSSGVSDTNTDTFATAIASYNYKSSGAQPLSAALCYAMNVASGSTTVTVNLSHAPQYDQSITVTEVSGIATTGALDQTVAAATAGCPSSCGTSYNSSSGASGTTSVANEYLYSFVTSSATPSWTSPTGGFAIINPSSGAQQSASLDQIVSATGAYTAGVGNTSDGTLYMMLATFEAPSAGGVVRRRGSVTSR